MLTEPAATRGWCRRATATSTAQPTAARLEAGLFSDSRQAVHWRRDSFCAQTNCADGNGPFAGLLQATDGNLYGTTVVGGTNNFGTVFKITSAGALTTLHSFDDTDGANVLGGVLQATDGTFTGQPTAAGRTETTARFSACRWDWLRSSRPSPGLARSERRPGFWEPI